MRKTILLFTALLLGCALFAEPLKKSVIRAESVHSSILSKDVAYNVYLPAGYDETVEYPVIYLLHGLYGIYSDWETRGGVKIVADELIASGELRPVVIICPNAGDADVHNVWNGYFNMPGYPFEDFFFKEFVPSVERRHHIIADKGHRAIMGLSMGGGGSVVYCQHHPEMFSSCYSMSGWLDNEKPDGDIIKSDSKDKLYYTAKSVSDNSAIAFVANADDATMEKLRTVKWFIDCGDDDFILDLSLDFYRTMRERKVKAELRVRDGWHSWEYWHTALRLSLPFASRNFDR